MRSLRRTLPFIQLIVLMGAIKRAHVCTLSLVRRAVMELWQLRTFRVVAETLNFTKAGKQLNLTQSAVSHQIKALETELGEPLFIRAQRGVRLSESGRITLEHAQRILDEAEALRERVTGREPSAAGSVRVAAAT